MSHISSMAKHSEAEAEDDEGVVFRRLRKTLCDSNGQSFQDIRRTLHPRFLRVWTEILIAYLVLFFAVAVIAFCAGTNLIWIAMPVATVVIGIAVAFLGLWFHEACHFNIARERRLNDILANTFMGLWLVQDIGRYRTVHFAHHANLGNTDDTERSYFEPLTLWFVIKSLTGLKVLEVLSVRGRKTKEKTGQSYLNLWTIGGVFVHGAILAGSLTFGLWEIAAAWALGIGVVFPFLGALRQLLEHRRPDASRSVNYTEVPHGAYTRVFGSGLCASILGGAGFNRHLIHHWDPTLSCTRFSEMEKFIEDTQIGYLYDRRKSSYLQTFKELFEL